MTRLEWIEIKTEEFGLNQVQKRFVVQKADYIVNRPKSNWYKNTAERAEKNNREMYAQAMHEGFWLLRNRTKETDLETYSRISKEEIEESEQLASVVIIPSDKDYEKGYIFRNFIARYDQPEASEVSDKTFKKAEKKFPKPYYSHIKFKWYLRDGVNFEKRKILNASSAEMLNEDQVIFHSQKFPQLKNTLKDFAQFIG